MRHARPASNITVPLRLLAVTLGLMLTACVSKRGAEPLVAKEDDSSLHVPSPDWRDQIIYFAMIDRFDDGDPGNNDQGESEYDPTQNAKYSGGDLAGLTRRLDYIRGLGATALWITPPVRHQWWDERNQYGGYHGYWGTHFMEVDPHFGILAEYRELSQQLHAADMYLVQDIVVNHMGNYFSYPKEWNAQDPLSGFVLNHDRSGRHAPTQRPFSENDVRIAKHRDADIYHWTPTITDYQKPEQEQRFQLADLDDLNTENPNVRAALRRSYGYWIKNAGVDAYRVDTAFYVPVNFFEDFLHSDDTESPGILKVAKQTGRTEFHLFGEGFGVDKPYADAVAKKIDRYMRDDAGRDVLPGMINFPLYGSIGEVFARGRPTAELGYRIQSMMRVHARPHLIPTFVDNHDVERFLSGGSIAALKQSLLLTMTLPGIPTIYYGTEQAFSGQRAAMFARGFESGGHDRFDSNAPMYRFIQSITRLRRTHKVLSRGVPEVLHENAASSGALAYRMHSGVQDEGSNSLIIVFNSADHETLLDHLDTGLPAGTVLEGVFAIDGLAEPLTVGSDGKITLRLAPHGGWVWQVGSRSEVPSRASVQIALDPLANTSMPGDFVITGSASGTGELQIVVDGDLSSAQTVTVDGNGQWQAMIDTGSMIDAAIKHSVVAWHSPSGTVSQRSEFAVSRIWSLLAEQADPVGDDSGPQGHYRYPSGADWTGKHQLDIRNVRVYGSNGAMRITLTMPHISADWNPSNGFDHVAFTISIQIPGQTDGSTFLPQQNTELPNGMRWQRRLRAHGWSNALFSSIGASRSNEGSALTPGADIQVDRARNTITFTLPAASLGRLRTLSGIKLHINTWDYDGGYKSLSPDANGQGFGGGDGTRDPLIMDDAFVQL